MEESERERDGGEKSQKQKVVRKKMTFLRSVGTHEILFTMSFVSITFHGKKSQQNNGRNNCKRHGRRKIGVFSEVETHGGEATIPHLISFMFECCLASLRDFSLSHLFFCSRAKLSLLLPSLTRRNKFSCNLLCFANIMCHAIH